jgi:hypothetical protein
LRQYIEGASRSDQIHRGAATIIASKISATNNLSQPSCTSTAPDPQSTATPASTICAETFECREAQARLEGGEDAEEEVFVETNSPMMALLFVG